MAEPDEFKLLKKEKADYRMHQRKRLLGEIITSKRIQTASKNKQSKILIFLFRKIMKKEKENKGREDS